MMEITFPDRPEQAIVAAVIKEAGRIIDQNNRGYLGRTAMQKILYFLQVCGVPLRYRFDVYHYGPFCAGLFNDIDWLTLMEIVVDKSEKPDKYSNYRTTAQSDVFLAGRREQVEPFLQQIRQVCEALVPLEPDQLELVATLDYAYRELKARTKVKPKRSDVIDRFVEFKGEKFPRTQVDKLFGRLEDVGVF